jgi:hypothetical protein
MGFFSILLTAGKPFRPACRGKSCFAPMNRGIPLVLGPFCQGLETAKILHFPA